jgi:AcrR family transcriptional regulator
MQVSIGEERMASTRRIGLESSANRAALMDGVEHVMRGDGYAALTARSVAEAVGLKHQLVYYYFASMDDLLLATYRRHTERVFARLEEASRAERPLHALWHVCSNPADATLNMEFLAMANHNPEIRALTVEIGERMRRVGLGKIEQQLRRSRLDRRISGALPVTLAISSIGSVIGLEATLGISGGHAELREAVEWYLDQLEPEPALAGVPEHS